MPLGPQGNTAAAGDQVTALYQVHATGLVRLAMLMLGSDQGAAEDVVQDAQGRERVTPGLAGHRAAAGNVPSDGTV